ncbi:hypothetical protein [Nocardioides marmoriginsengisoli]|uniref:hypothetical protein n=1 Tax=Nocardioides marmoriginsengisoli TaxID=661483 RepID=UPI001616B150|nr:hypothetical protein [Nocardioides marmoriginsengisoli]
MAQTKNQQRAADAVAAWMAHLEWNNTQLVAATNADPGTIGDFLNGKRWPKIGTQGRIERALGWPAGTLRTIAAGGPAPDPAATVGGQGKDQDPYDDAVRFRRPDGLTDLQWQRIKSEAQGFIEWQIEKTVRGS